MDHIHAGDFGSRYAVNCDAAKSMDSIDRHNLKYILPMGGFATKVSIARKGAEVTCPSCLATLPACAVCQAPAWVTFDTSMPTWEASKPACLRCYEERGK